ncbi:MAG: xanthine dehydrogenase family protein subunit M [Deltaproteobacteria bacterium]|nr:xanthine dehydrogenase family protein subunit M [Deltaproteobacteria bacterium]
MKAKFEYLAPTSLDEACALLQEHSDDAKLLAGGTALVMWMRMGLLSPGFVIDLERVPGLDGIDYDPSDGLRIGAGVKHRDLELCPEVREHYPLLQETFYKVAQPRIRLMATVGGNLSHGDPLTDPGASFMALDAEVTLRGSRGERTLSVEEFFVDYYETALEPDEILTSVHVPPPAGTAWSHIKFTPRSEEDFATVGVAVTMSGEGSRCDDVRIALNSVGPTIFRAHAAEDLLRGRDITPERVVEAGAAAAEASDPIEDVRGTSDYKRDLVAVFVHRAVEQAAAKLS